MADGRWSDLPPMIAQGQLLDEIARDVAAARPARPVGLVFEASILSTRATFAVYVVEPDGTRTRVFAPDRAKDLSTELRSVMFRPGAGTWFSMTMTLPTDGSVSTRFNYDEEPPWTRDPGGLAYLKDLERFPRDPENQPPWLVARLAEGRELRSGTFGPQVWNGVRFQASFTTDGSPVRGPANGPVDASAWAWAEQVAERLTAGGAPAGAGQEEDPHQVDVTYPLVSMSIGRGGYCGLLFLPGLVAWTVDVARDQAERAQVQSVLSLVRTTVEQVTGWSLVAEQVSDGYTHVMVGLGPLA